MYIRIGSLCSILCWSIFGSNHSSLRLERCTAVLITLQRWEFGLCPEATPVLSWLCACSCCPVWRLTFAPVWGPERSGAGYRQGSIHLYLISLPVPAVKKHPHSMKLPPPCFTVGVALIDWCPALGSVFVSSHHPSGAFWQTAGRLSCATQAWLVECRRNACPEQCSSDHLVFGHLPD